MKKILRKQFKFAQASFTVFFILFQSAFPALMYVSKASALDISDPFSTSLIGSTTIEDSGNVIIPNTQNILMGQPPASPSGEQPIVNSVTLDLYSIYHGDLVQITADVTGYPITTCNAEISSDSSFSTSTTIGDLGSDCHESFNITGPDGDGTYYIRVVATDNMGYESYGSPISDPLQISTPLPVDTEAPVITFSGFKDQASATYDLTQVTKVCGSYNSTGYIAWEWTLDNIEVDPVKYSYLITAGPHAGFPATTYETHYNGLVPTEGYYEVEVYGTDNSGNVGTPVQCSMTYDDTAPSVPTGGLPNGTILATNEFDFTWNPSSDANSPLTYEFQSSLNPAQTDGVLTDPGAWHSGILPSNMIHSSGAGDGTWYWQVRAIDPAGNTSNWSEIWTVTLDTTRPATPTGLTFESVDRLIVYQCGDWLPMQPVIPNWADNSGDPTFSHYEYTSFWPDGHIGLDEQIFFSSEFVNNWIPPTDGAYGYSVRAVDTAGNKSDWALSGETLAGSCQVNYDSVAPSIPVLTWPIAGLHINDNTPLMQWDDSTDDASGVAGYYYRIQYNCIDENNPATCSSLYPNLTGTWVVPSQLQAGVTPNNVFYWQVMAEDNAGNQSDWSALEKFRIDTVLPVLTLPSNIEEEAEGPLGNIVDYIVSAEDAVDGTLSVTCDYPSGSLFSIQTTLVTCTATDTAGNVATGTFTVLVQDLTAPTFGLIEDLTREATDSAGADVTHDITATDIVDGDVPVYCDPSSGTHFALGDTTVTCTATDSHGNSTTATFTVTVQDTTAPTVYVPADMEVEATGLYGAYVDFSAEVSAYDLVDGVLPVSCVPTWGSAFPLYATTPVTCTATDALGHTGSSSFNITVIDTTPPTTPTNLGFINPNLPCGAITNIRTVTVDWDDSFDASGIAGYSYYIDYPLIGGGRGTWNPFFVNSQYTGTLNPGIHYVMVRAKDNTGLYSEWTELCSITYDNIAPTVDLQFPSIGPSATSFLAEFSEEMNETEVEDGLNYYLHNWPGYGGSGDLSGDATIVYDNSTFTATITFTTPGWYISPEQLWGLQNLHDLAGNVITVNPYEEYSTPMVAPVTTALGIDDSWHNTPVTVTFSCSDIAGSGCKTTYYSIDGAPFVAGSSVTISADGEHTVDHYSIDNAGNIEEINYEKQTVNIDTVLPISILDPIDSPIADTTLTFIGSASDDNGVLAVEYRVDGGSWIDIPLGEILTDIDFTFTTTELLDGSHTIQLRAMDIAGNWEVIYDDESQQIVIVDVTPPNIPTSLGFNVAPGDVNDPVHPAVEIPCGGFTNINSKSFRWTDESGSGAVEYEIEWLYPDSSEWRWDEIEFSVLPYESDFYVFGTQKTPMQGLWHFRVRAYDEPGNVSEWSEGCAITLDTLPPSMSMISSEDLYEGQELPHVKVTAEDNLGGIRACFMLEASDDYYDKPETCSSFESGTSVEWNVNTLFDLPSIVDTAIIPEGTYTFTYWAEDESGNESDTNNDVTYRVFNVAPSSDDVIPDIDINEGESITVDVTLPHSLEAFVTTILPANTISLSFEDPSTLGGSDDSPWTASFNYDTEGNPTNFVDVNTNTYFTNGRYKVTVRVTESDENGGEGEFGEKIFFVNVADIIPTVVTTGIQNANGSYTFTANANGGNAPLSYNWVGSCSGTGVTTTTGTTPGTYTCKVTVTDADGDTAESTIVRVISAPYNPGTGGVGGPAEEEVIPTTSVTPTISVTPEGEILGLLDQNCETAYTASGYAYIDANNNGIKDDGEKVLSGIEAGIYVGESFLLKITTDSDGKWSQRLCPGDYTMKVVSSSLPSNVKAVNDNMDIKINDSDTNSNINLALTENAVASFNWWLLLILAAGIGGLILILRRRAGNEPVYK